MSTKTTSDNGRTVGVRTVDGFGVLVDNAGHRFVAQASIVAQQPVRSDHYGDS